MTPEARDLIRAFQAQERPEMVAALINEDGFDALTIRVLTAWMNTEHEWKAVSKTCPDDGRPTPRSWAWLIAGIRVDYETLAMTADVSLSVARQKVALLLGNRLVYPDGAISKAAMAALQAAVRARVKMPRGQADSQEKKPKAVVPKGEN